MPLTGEYEPSTFDFSRGQVELYESSGGTEGTDNQGKPVIVLTSVGAKSGKLRKTPLMRVEHDGEYAVVASLGGAPKHPVWYYNLIANPHVELQDGPVKKDYQAREVDGDEYAGHGSTAPSRCGRTTPSTRRRRPGRCRSSSSHPWTRSRSTPWVRAVRHGRPLTPLCLGRP